MKKYKKSIIAMLTSILVLFGGYQFGARTMNPIWNISDLDVEVSIGSFTDATTTPISVLNPFGATSTVDFMLYDQTGVATSTYTMDCGVATTQFASPSDLLIDGLSVATSTTVYMVNSENDSGTNSESHVIVGPTEYISCLIVPIIEAAITNTGNTYDGNYKIRWIK